MKHLNNTGEQSARVLISMDWAQRSIRSSRAVSPPVPSSAKDSWQASTSIHYTRWTSSSRPSRRGPLQPFSAPCLWTAVPASLPLPTSHTPSRPRQHPSTGLPASHTREAASHTGCSLRHATCQLRGSNKSLVLHSRPPSPCSIISSPIRSDSSTSRCQSLPNDHANTCFYLSKANRDL